MPRLFTLSTIATYGVAILLMSGCADSSSETTTSTDPGLPPDTADAGHDDHDGHDHDDHEGHDHGHPSEGPHHGSLIELGGEEYHAEFVHDEDAGTVTIYILDGAAKEAVAIDATEIAINLKHDGKGEQFKLAASPDEGDPQGKSSRFVSADKELGEDLHHEDADASLVLKINGKSYRGAISHDQDHDDDHDHGHDDDHKK